MNNKPFKIKISQIIIFLWFYCSIAFAQNIAEIKSLEGVPALFINEKPYPPFAYMSYLGEKEYYEEIAATGVHLYCFPAFLGDRGINTESGIGPFRRPIWIGEDKYDFSSVIEDFEKIVQSDPKAKVIIRIHLDPPLWWEKMNPDASAHLANKATFRQSFYSNKWKNETAKVLQDFVQWLIHSSYSKHLIGIHVAAGATEEWFYHPPQYNDKNPVKLAKFRDWLKSKYGNDITALQNAWNDKSIVFETAKPGNVLEKNTNRWRDPLYEQNMIDTYQFQAETLVDNISYFCKTVKESSNGGLLAGVFSGYHYFVSDPRRGHGALAKLLTCKYLDYISSPNVYHRVIGEDWAPMAAVQSVQLHGKLWLAENDTRTSITTLLKDRAPQIAPVGYYEDGVWLGPEDIKTSESFLWKNAGRMLAYGYGGWWFDMWGGWFSDPKLLNVIRSTNDFFMKFPQEQGTQMQAEVCVMVDEELSFWDASYGNLTERILSNRYSLAKTGAPYDLFLRTDLEKIPSNPYKVFWLKGFLRLSEKEKKKIQDWQKQGNTVIWTNSKGTTIFKNNQESFINNVFFLSDSQLRDLFKNAGVHVYSDSGDVFYVGRNWLCIHSIFGGMKKINLPFIAKITNPIDNKLLQNNTKIVEIDMESKSTVLLRIDPL